MTFHPDVPRTAALIRSIPDLEAAVTPTTRAVTLFSGGLDSAYVLWLLSRRGCRNVTALTVDLGDAVDRERLEQTARHFGAALRILDARELFAREGVLPSIAAQSIYLGVHPISSSLTRPIIARAAVSLARELGADVIVHTANQSQNTLRRLNGALGRLGFSGAYGTPYELSAVDRGQKIAALARAGLPEMTARSHSGDSNLWCREFESGSLDNPEAFEVPEALYRWSASHPAPDLREETVAVEFAEGVPVAVDGVAMAPVDLIAHLNGVAGRYGLGRYSGLEEIAAGHKVLEVREMPAAQLLLAAYRQLETATVSAETIREKMHMEQLWTREAIEGRWFGLLRESVQGFIMHVARRVTGTIKFRLAWRSLEVRSIVAEHPLYLTDRDAWESAAATRELSRWVSGHGRTDPRLDGAMRGVA